MPLCGEVEFLQNWLRQRATATCDASSGFTQLHPTLTYSIQPTLLSMHLIVPWCTCSKTRAIIRPLLRLTAYETAQLWEEIHKILIILILQTIVWYKQHVNLGGFFPDPGISLHWRSPAWDSSGLQMLCCFNATLSSLNLFVFFSSINKTTNEETGFLHIIVKEWLCVLKHSIKPNHTRMHS